MFSYDKYSYTDTWDKYMFSYDMYSYTLTHGTSTCSATIHTHTH